VGHVDISYGISALWNHWIIGWLCGLHGPYKKSGGGTSKKTTWAGLIPGSRMVGRPLGKTMKNN